jgi:hypothetical protein
MVIRSDCWHTGDDVGSTNGWCVCKVTSVKLICPVCASCHEERQTLKAHLREAHTGLGKEMVAFRQRVLALVGMEAAQMLGGDVWDDIIHQLRLGGQ